MSLYLFYLWIGLTYLWNHWYGVLFIVGLVASRWPNSAFAKWLTNLAQGIGAHPGLVIQCLKDLGELVAKLRPAPKP